jgi:hypothetical protein
MSTVSSDMAPTPPAPDAPQPISGAVQEPLIETIARAGYAAKGIVYLIVGFLAAEAAVGAGGQLGGGKQGLGAMLAKGTPGAILVGLVGGGLLAFAAWNFIRAVFNNEHVPRNLKGYLKRFGWAFTGLIYIALGVWALHAAVSPSSDAHDKTRDWVGTALQYTGGAIVAGGVGAYIAGYGVFQIVKSMRRSACRNLDLSRLGAWLRPVASKLCGFGVAARGVVAIIVGAFIVHAAWTLNKDNAGGPGDAMHSLLQWRFGWAVLAIVAVGLMAYGAFIFMKCAFKRIDHAPKAVS